MRWGLSERVERINLSDETTAAVANALIKDTQYQKGIELIRDHIESRAAKADALQAVAQTAVRLDSPELLNRALTVTSEIDNYPRYKSWALRAIARAAGQLDESEHAQKVLSQALATAEALDDPGSRHCTLPELR